MDALREWTREALRLRRRRGEVLDTCLVVLVGDMNEDQYQAYKTVQAVLVFILSIVLLVAAVKCTS